jgi:hypothetical protein
MHDRFVSHTIYMYSDKTPANFAEIKTEELKKRTIWAAWSQ